ncbi:hypothetical protein GLOTRDRAFT_115002 [Gloeophyllum trabeum ATCC 11539]|uniref:RBR-type E3 ubiquitin transferase n=1 Tax=Gloeophyllum trabeum (strain ATCC 11539 / FP-39264 / Madison 617) TaxID=670483 RepID=S7QHE9_GLOTA|nr:uncharacterized protein GLOTRDRAFT_115002 [Gloeophyllum trabeum ATCC 11539]EPQ58678.1 hypothetical protein GLOTRDRAFT_115002 [Gloeophyllum trabeum ATCC 11539]
MSDSDYAAADDSDVEYPFLDDDGGDHVCNVDYASKGKEKEHTTRISFRSLSPDELQNMIDDDIRELAAIIPCQQPVISILLRHFHWNRERLLEKYVEDAVQMFKTVAEPYDPPASPTLRPNKRARLEAPADDPKYSCGICFDEYDSHDTFETRCGHRFCNTCWNMYLESKIKEEGQCSIKCMGDSCKTVVDEPSIAQLVDASCYQRYRKLLQESYVAANPALRFCPHPSCTQTVYCQGVTQSILASVVPTVSCGAEHLFCFGCGLDSDHKPLICKLVKIWLKNSREDAGTAQWIKANTRTCPKCQQSIEKAGGCNTWKEPEPDENMTDAKKSLEKWLFYFDRFNNHEVSANLDQELVERTKEKVVKVQEASNLSWIEAKFMEDAVDELTKCRRTLKWTYAMAHFLAPGNKKQMFEDLQANLEKGVEDLSQLLEEPIDPESIQSLRQRMIDKTVYVQKRHEILREDTASRLSEGNWEWTVQVE